MARRAFPVLLLALLLAGCSSAAPPDVPPTPTASASMAPAPVAPPPPAILTGACETGSGLAWGTPVGASGSAQSAKCPFSAASTGDFTNFTAALVEVVWTPGATVTGAELFVQSDSCYSSVGADSSGVHDSMCNIGTTRGDKGPLRIEVSQDQLAKYARDNMTAQAIPEGASTSQPFTFYVTLFEGPMPSGFSAIPA